MIYKELLKHFRIKYHKEFNEMFAKSKINGVKDYQRFAKVYVLSLIDAEISLESCTLNRKCMKTIKQEIEEI